MKSVKKGGSQGFYHVRNKCNIKDHRSQMIRNRPTQADPPPMKVSLEVVEGPHAGMRFDFQNHDNFIVGRSPQAHFRLPQRDKTFSRFHFMVEVNPPFCRVIDMASRNGTFLNGKPVGVASLANGDEIRGGETRFRVGIDTEGSDEFDLSSGKWERIILPPRSRPADEETLRPSKGDQADVPSSASAQVEGEPEIRQIGKYEIQCELGRGGMGIVYKARHQSTGRVDAVKTITPAVAGSENVVGRFLREVAILRRLKHPNIVEFREFGHDLGRLYLAMEYVSGTNASSLRKRAGGRLPQFLAVEIACQTLSALAYAHDRGFIHRDIKPRNLLVTRRDGKVCVKVADFGLARMYQDSPMSGLSFTGEIAGTSGYIPPEQVTNFRSTDPAADQYAMGATLYHLLCGKKIHDFPPNLAQQLLMILQEEPVPIQKRFAEIPDDLARAVHKALQRNPEDRYPDVSAMLQALEPFRTPEKMPEASPEP